MVETTMEVDLLPWKLVEITSMEKIVEEITSMEISMEVGGSFHGSGFMSMEIGGRFMEVEANFRGSILKNQIVWKTVQTSFENLTKANLSILHNDILPRYFPEGYPARAVVQMDPSSVQRNLGRSKLFVFHFFFLTHYIIFALPSPAPSLS